MRAALRAMIFAAGLVACLGAGGYRRTIQLRGTEFPNTLVVLVDNSGSMAGEPYGCAIRQALWVTEQASDGARVRFAAFGQSTVWERDDWTKLPDAEALAISRVWLQSRGTSGNTFFADAVEEALRIEESPLGVVVISDCDPTETLEETRARIARANASREPGPATIGVISIAPKAEQERFALLVASDASGPAVKLEPKTK